MPILDSSYCPSFFFKNGHFATIYPNFFRAVKNVVQQRERVELPDDDFIAVDWSFGSTIKSEKLAVIVHGLEGNAQRQYMLGLTAHLTTNGWDVAGVNLRNCSGTPNRQYRSYTAGVTEDLDAVISHIIAKYAYATLGLCGFSLGGNLVLKYLGEQRKLPKSIKVGAAISAPCDLYDSLQALNAAKNSIYSKRFLKHLKAKLYEKQLAFPERLSIADIDGCRSLIAVDDLYTSKAHGYTDAMAYYKACSSKQFLTRIEVPTLLVNAANDSFLGSKCYPVVEAKNNSNLHLEIPKYGGHVGFYLPNNVYYHEQRILDFLEAYV